MTAVAAAIALKAPTLLTSRYREGLVTAVRPLSLDPYVHRRDPAVHDVGHLLYRCLLRLDAQSYPAGDLASAYSVTPDGLAYSFQLREGLRWSDGSPLTVSDVAATVAFVESPGFPDPDVAEAWRGVVPAIDPSRRTVILRIPSPRASFAAGVADLPILPLARSGAARADPASLRALAGDATSPRPTSGPFEVEANDEEGLRLVPNRYAETRPRLPRVDFRLFDSFDAADRSLASGGIDGLLATTPDEQHRLDAAGMGPTHPILTYRFVDVLFNERTPGLADPSVRTAIGAAIDRHRLVSSVLGGAGVVQTGALPSGIRWVQPDAPLPGASGEADPARASLLLDRAGWLRGAEGIRLKGGVRLGVRLAVLDVDPLPAVAEDVARQLAPLGIAAQVERVPTASFESALLPQRNFDMALADWDSGPDPDLTTFWRSNAEPPHGFNVSGAAPNPFLDQALDSLATLDQRAPRRAAAARVERLLEEDPPAAFLYAPVMRLSVRDTIGSVTVPTAGTSADRFDSLASWTAVPARDRLADAERLLVTGLAVVIAVAAVVVTGARAAAWLVPPGEGSLLERLAVALLLDLVQVVGVLLLLGAVHLLWPAAVLAAHTAIAAGALLLLPRRPPRSADPVPTREWTAVLAIGIPFAALSIAHGLSGPSGEADTRRYHVVNAAHWLDDHSTLTLPFAAPGDGEAAAAPGDADLVGLWTMLPTHSDGLSYSYNLAFAVLCVVAAALAARELGGSPSRGALAGLVALSAPVSFLTQSASMLSDVAVAAGIVTAVAIVLRGRRDPPVRGWPLLAGLALGLAAGSKFAGLVPALCVAVWAVATCPAPRLRALGGLAGGMALLAGFWYLRNWVATGDPVFPQRVAIGGWTIFSGGATFPGSPPTTLAARLGQGGGGALLDWGRSVLDMWGPVLPLLVLLAVPLAAVATVRRRRVLGSVGVLVVALLVVHAVTPYSGGDHGQAASALRYTLGLGVLAAVAGAVMLPRPVWLVACAAGLAFGAARAIHEPLRPDLQLTPAKAVVALLLAMALAGAIAGAPAVLRWLRRASWRQRALAAAGGTLATSGAVAAVLGAAEPATATPLSAALSDAGRPEGRVVVVHEADVRAVLGPRLDTDIVAADDPGDRAHRWAVTAGELDARIASLSPAAVVVGQDGVDPLPPGWRPPPSWSLATELEDGARVYLP